jgi:long-subunit acyl-CoA synthetase (AMP-forming)
MQEKKYWQKTFSDTRIKAIFSNRRILRVRWLWRWLRKYSLYSIDSAGWGVRFFLVDDDRFSIEPTAPRPTGDSEEVLVTLTSGTTGHPKAISRIFRIFISQQNLVCKYLPPLEVDIHLPLYGVALLQSLIEGSTTILAKDHSPSTIADLLRRYQVTRLSGPPPRSCDFF